MRKHLKRTAVSTIVLSLPVYNTLASIVLSAVNSCVDAASIAFSKSVNRVSESSTCPVWWPLALVLGVNANDWESRFPRRFVIFLVSSFWPSTEFYKVDMNKILIIIERTNVVIHALTNNCNCETPFSIRVQNKSRNKEWNIKVSSWRRRKARYRLRNSDALGRSVWNSTATIGMTRISTRNRWFWEGRINWQMSIILNWNQLINIIGWWWRIFNLKKDIYSLRIFNQVFILGSAVLVRFYTHNCMHNCNYHERLNTGNYEKIQTLSKLSK